jgi:GntR family transcriptional repressor for pyruvate dehydrogenase complex
MNLSDEVAQQIQELVQEGVFKLGEKLPPERELCEKFQVSRTSVREALKGLISKGLLEKRSDGTYVREKFDNIFVEPLTLLITSKKLNIADIFEARSVLEIQNAGLAAKKATEEDIRRMEECIIKMENPKNTREAVLNYATEFHQMIAKATHNPILEDIFKVMFHIFVQDPRSIKNIKKSTAFHRDIYEKIKNRDAAGAEEAMRKHLIGIVESYKYGM